MNTSIIYGNCVQWAQNLIHFWILCAFAGSVWLQLQILNHRQSSKFNQSKNIFKKCACYTCILTDNYHEIEFVILSWNHAAGSARRKWLLLWSILKRGFLLIYGATAVMSGLITVSLAPDPNKYSTQNIVKLGLNTSTDLLFVISQGYGQQIFVTAATAIILTQHSKIWRRG